MPSPRPGEGVALHLTLQVKRRFSTPHSKRRGVPAVGTPARVAGPPAAPPVETRSRRLVSGPEDPSPAGPEDPSPAGPEDPSPAGPRSASGGSRGSVSAGARGSVSRARTKPRRSVFAEPEIRLRSLGSYQAPRIRLHRTRDPSPEPGLIPGPEEPSPPGPEDPSIRRYSSRVGRGTLCVQCGAIVRAD